MEGAESREYNIEQIEPPVLILALDTTTRAGSVAILRDAQVLYEQAGDGSITHGQRLPTDLKRACEIARIQVADLDLLAVAAGPGSFTGLRIGIATTQGLAMALGLRIVPVSTLEAIAVAAPGPDRRVAAWMDAQRGEVFAQVFERSPAGDELQPATDAVSLAPDIAIDVHRTALHGATFHGDGAVRYRAVIEEAFGEQVSIASECPPLAAAIARIARRHPDRAVLPHAVVPIYVRRPDAELARERRDSRT